MNHTPPIVLTIAGFDPSSGAGITADIKTIAAHGCYGVACITALTVQSTAGVRRVKAVAADLIKETLAELRSDTPFQAVHIGMLGSAENANAIADFLAASTQVNVVLDPVLKSTSGTNMLDPAGVAVLVEKLIPLATVITPNLYEASVLAGIAVANEEDMLSAAAALHVIGAKGVVITGGHLDEPADLLSIAGNPGPQQEFFRGKDLESNSTHGTGCAFSTSLACHLAQGRSLPEAVPLAQVYVISAITEAYPVGQGIGPINHLARMQKK